MSLSDVLNNLTGARDALVSAINGKGGSVATTATLRQCAEAVTALPEGGGAAENDPVFDGLIFYLSFDRWMTDSVSDLEIPFADVEAEPGKNDLCGHFDGRNSWAAIPKESISVRGKSEWSVGFWFKPEQPTQTIINSVYAEWNESSYGASRFSVQLSNELKIFSQINFTDGQDVDLMRVERDTPLVVGDWYYISVTVNLPSKEMLLYVNGELVASDSNAEAPNVSPSSLPHNDPQLMNWFTGETNPSSGGEPLYETAGSLDEFAFWGRALSADEVAALYNSGNGLFYENMNGIAGGGGVEIPGQIFYASFSSDSEYAESGQPLIKVGNPQFVVEDGTACMKLESSAIYTEFPCFLGNTPFTVSFWGKAPEAITNEFHIIWAGENQTYGKVHFEIVNGKFGISDSLSFFYTEDVVTGNFHHFLVTYDGNKLSAYVDNVLAIQSGNFTADIALSSMFVGKTINVIEAGPFFISTLRIFTRVLSADEISTLYDEFVNRDNPSGGGSSGGGGSSLLQGIAFYSSLTDVETSETADKMNMTGNVTVTSVDGVTSGNFNGSSYLTAETYKKLPQFSVCVWLNCATEMSNYGWAIASGEFNFRMEIYNAAIYATAWGANGINEDPLEGRVSTALTINTWQFIVYSFDSENYRLHKNSMLVSQAEKEKANFIPFFDNICLGGVSNSAYGKFNGNISDAIIYNRALTDEEIAELYALGPGGFEKIWYTKKSNEGTLFFTTTEADGKVEGGYMFAGTGTLKLQLATGEITELSLTDTMQRAFSAYELSNVRVVSGAQSVTWLSINRIGIDYIDLSNFWSLEHLHMPISSSPEIKNLSSCHRLNYVDVGDSALSSAQVDQILSDILASNSHLNDESFSGSIDVSQNAVPTAAGLETIAQLESVGWSVNYDRE